MILEVRRVINLLKEEFGDRWRFVCTKMGGRHIIGYEGLKDAEEAVGWADQGCWNLQEVFELNCQVGRQFDIKF